MDGGSGGGELAPAKFSSKCLFITDNITLSGTTQIGKFEVKLRKYVRTYLGRLCLIRDDDLQ